MKLANRGEIKTRKTSSKNRRALIRAQELATVDQNPDAGFGQLNDKGPFKGTGHGSEGIRMNVESEPQLRPCELKIPHPSHLRLDLVSQREKALVVDEHTF